MLPDRPAGGQPELPCPVVVTPHYTHCLIFIFLCRARSAHIDRAVRRGGGPEGEGPRGGRGRGGGQLPSHYGGTAQQQAQQTALHYDITRVRVTVTGRAGVCW